MSKSIICNYEVQAEKEPGKLTIQGAMRFKEAFNLLIQELIRINGKIGYIWPQTHRARNYLSKNYTGSDLVKVTISGNIEGMKIGLI